MTGQLASAVTAGSSGTCAAAAFTENTKCGTYRDGVEAFISRCQTERLALGLAAQVEDESVLDVVATILDVAEGRPGAP